MDKEKPIVIYCYDALCGWCYGFSGVMTRLFDEYKDRYDFEVLSGGMVPAESASHISGIAGYIRGAYKRVEEMTGVTFGQDYLWHINNPELSDWHLHSEIPAIAMAVFRDYHPNDTIQFAADLQFALYGEGRDLTDSEAYRHLLDKYEIPADEFYQKLQDPAYKDKAHYDFALVKQLQVTGFPAVLVQTEESKFYLVGKGYTDYETMKERLEKILETVNNSTIS